MRGIKTAIKTNGTTIAIMRVLAETPPLVCAAAAPECVAFGVISVPEEVDTVDRTDSVVEVGFSD